MPSCDESEPQSAYPCTRYPKAFGSGEDGTPREIPAASAPFCFFYTCVRRSKYQSCQIHFEIFRYTIISIYYHFCVGGDRTPLSSQVWLFDTTWNSGRSITRRCGLTRPCSPVNLSFEQVTYSRVDGQGMNFEELNRNQRLDAKRVKFDEGDAIILRVFVDTNITLWEGQSVAAPLNLKAAERRE